MQRIRLLVVLIAVLIITACRPENPLPNTILSQDPFGEIELRYPNPWRDVSEARLANGSQPVTLVYSEGIPEKDIEQYPLIRVTYANRTDTELGDGGSLSEYAVRNTQTVAAGVPFEPPQVEQVAQRAAVRLRGTGPDGRETVLLVIDYADVNGVVTLALFQPGRITERDEAVLAQIAQTIRLEIAVPTIPPEATAQVSPESTAEIAPESTVEVVATSEIAPESNAEAVPDTTDEADARDEVETTEEATPDATDELDATEEATTRTPRNRISTTEADTTERVTPDATDELDAAEEVTPPTPRNRTPVVEMDSTAEATLAPDTVDVRTPAIGSESTAEVAFLPETTVEPTPDATQTAIAEATSIAARTVKIARNLSVLTPEGWSSVSNNHSYIVLNLGNNIARAVLNQEPLPAGEALIVIEVGTVQELFPPGSPGDMMGRLRHRMETLVEDVEGVTFGETRTTQINNKNAAEMLITSAIDDQYVVLVEIGGNVFIQIKLLTAKGEIGSFSPIAYEVAQSIVPR
jgi:hypothetical protein